MKRLSLLLVLLINVPIHPSHEPRARTAVVGHQDAMQIDHQAEAAREHMAPRGRGVLTIPMPPGGAQEAPAEMRIEGEARHRFAELQRHGVPNEIVFAALEKFGNQNPELELQIWREARNHMPPEPAAAAGFPPDYRDNVRRAIALTASQVQKRNQAAYQRNQAEHRFQDLERWGQQMFFEAPNEIVFAALEEFGNQNPQLERQIWTSVYHILPPAPAAAAGFPPMYKAQIREVIQKIAEQVKQKNQALNAARPRGEAKPVREKPADQERDVQRIRLEHQSKRPMETELEMGIVYVRPFEERILQMTHDELAKFIRYVTKESNA